ncbi:hypothetical protein BX070DRAFT_218470 [Coemansia spiralis]|nr:hypothetical protein BX070DRAFT_218470 [Coemansia spiralis]
MSLFELLPQNVFNQIALQLSAADVAALALTSHRLNRQATNNSLWLEKISADFGDRALIIDLLSDSGIDITELVTNSSDLVSWGYHQHKKEERADIDESETESEKGSLDSSISEQNTNMLSIPNATLLYGMHCYRDRFIRVFPPSKNDAVKYIKRSEAEIDQIKSMLRDGPQASSEVFSEASYRLLLVQEYFPNSVECYYLWALICFMHNAFKQSLAFLGIGKSIDETFVPIQELSKEVQLISGGVYGTNGESPLLNDKGTGPSVQLSKALSIIFQQLDCDRDGVLNASELASMIKVTNGQPAPRSMILQIISSFGGSIQTKGGRKVPGWDLNSLTSFYISQTLDDPGETRSDLAKFGFDPHTLGRI